MTEDELGTGDGSEGDDGSGDEGEDGDNGADPDGTNTGVSRRGCSASGTASELWLLCLGFSILARSYSRRRRRV